MGRRGFWFKREKERRSQELKRRGRKEEDKSKWLICWRNGQKGAIWGDIKA